MSPSPVSFKKFLPSVFGKAMMGSPLEEFGHAVSTAQCLALIIAEAKHAEGVLSQTDRDKLAQAQQNISKLLDAVYEYMLSDPECLNLVISRVKGQGIYRAEIAGLEARLKAATKVQAGLSQIRQATLKRMSELSADVTRAMSAIFDEAYVETFVSVTSEEHQLTAPETRKLRAMMRQTVQEENAILPLGSMAQQSLFEATHPSQNSEDISELPHLNQFCDEVKRSVMERMELNSANKEAGKALERYLSNESAKGKSNLFYPVEEALKSSDHPNLGKALASLNIIWRCFSYANDMEMGIKERALACVPGREGSGGARLGA
jgi:hypothetical protein